MSEPQLLPGLKEGWMCVVQEHIGGVPGPAHTWLPSWLCRFPAMAVAGHFTSHFLGFLVCKMGRRDSGKVGFPHRATERNSVLTPVTCSVAHGPCWISICSCYNCLMNGHWVGLPGLCSVGWEGLCPICPMALGLYWGES